MTESEPNAKLKQAKQDALAFLSDNMDHATDDSYTTDKNALAINKAIKLIRESHEELDEEDSVSAVLAACWELEHDLDCHPHSIAAESLNVVYRAGEDAGYEFGQKVAEESLEGDFATYMDHHHKGGSDAREVMKGFIAWWTKDSDSSSS